MEITMEITMGPVMISASSIIDSQIILTKASSSKMLIEIFYLDQNDFKNFFLKKSEISSKR
jgi:hypothetical protein